MKQKLYPNSTKNLREALETEGFRFPCGGKWMCGRCRILAPMLAPTALDSRFFSAEDIARGMRLACDKTFDAPIEIDVYMEKAPKKRKLYEPLAYVLLGDETSEVGILEDGELVESLYVYSPAADTVSLRALAGKNAIELYEKYGVAKASTMLVAGTAERMERFMGGMKAIEELEDAGDTLPAAMFDMPSEEVYLPPIPNTVTGSLQLLELDGIEDGSFLLHIGERYTLLYKGAVTVTCASLTADTGDEAAFCAVAAALRFFTESFSPYHLYYVGKADSRLVSLLETHRISITKKDSAASERARAALFDNRYKTRLNKLARKAAVISLADEERYLTILAEMSQ